MPPIAERPDAADREPLLGVLHRRHPDVDVVVLAPERAPDTAPPPATLEEAVALAERCREAVQDATAGRPTGPTATLWWRQGTDGSHRHVARTTVTGLAGPADAMAQLARLAERLADEGWRVERLLDPRPRVRATRGPLALRADAFPTALEVEVLSEALVLDAAQLRRLRARSHGAAR